MKPTLIKDLGRLFPTDKSKQKTRMWIVECPVCEDHYTASAQSIKSGASSKCKTCGSKLGATGRKVYKKHGMTGTRIHRIWLSMRGRCNYNIEYSGRGISVCENWEESFSNFHTWSLLNGYSDKLSIDRIDNNGNYEPSNCRWTTSTVQNRNTRRISKLNTSGYRGVIYDKKSHIWRAQITVNRKNIIVGKYENKIDAAIAYDDYVISNKLEHTINNAKEQH